ncbi:hypothetical protein BCR44DRAFT_1020086 [Catenaria anguillulae PL171]|uniref:Uncharacterized protein n=1 Tax=Catenaria anguillulae PL171 TaxID=765915 RepID=A0A1Y2H6G5_9FUNG|nr:hypothetical protein BCR44DRAFT_1020086 [Catenaria anguillulae PL171]
MSNRESSETCLFCVPIRKGVLFLIFLGFVHNIVSGALAWTSVSSLIALRPAPNPSDAYIMMIIDLCNTNIVRFAIAAAVYSVCALFTLWGGWAAYKRRASHFKVEVGSTALERGPPAPKQEERDDRVNG